MTGFQLSELFLVLSFDFFYEVLHFDEVRPHGPVSPGQLAPQLLVFSFLLDYNFLETVDILELQPILAFQNFNPFPHCLQIFRWRRRWIFAPETHPADVAGPAPQSPDCLLEEFVALAGDAELLLRLLETVQERERSVRLLGIGISS